MCVRVCVETWAEIFTNMPFFNSVVFKSWLAKELHLERGCDERLSLPVAQILPRFALAAKALLAGGENAIQKHLVSNSIEDETRRPRLSKLISLVHELHESSRNGGPTEEEDVVRIGKEVVYAIQAPAAQFAELHSHGLFYPHHCFIGGTKEGRTAVAASVVCLAAYVFSVDSCKALLSLLRCSGRGSLIQVTPLDEEGMVNVYACGRDYQTTNNITTSQSLVRFVVDVQNCRQNTGFSQQFLSRFDYPPPEWCI